MARLLYGSGLRLLECIRLRIQDVDFGQHLICVRGAKGGQDRTTILPRNLGAALQAQIEAVKALHHQDLEEGFGAVYLPEALARQDPKAARETGWQWVFPARARALDPRSGREMRHHVLESGLQKAVKRAAEQARARQEGQLPDPAPQFCDPYAGARGQHPRAPGTARPRRCEDHREVHPRHGAGHPAITKPAGPVTGLTAVAGREAARPCPRIVCIRPCQNTRETSGTWKGHGGRRGASVNTGEQE